MPSFTYKSYSFVDKDPMIDYIRTIIAEGSLSMREIEESSGVSQNTIRNWLYGDTKRPQAASINAVLRVLEYQLSIAKIGTPMIIIPTAIEPKAVEPTRRKRMGAAKYVNIQHHAIARRKRKS